MQHCHLMQSISKLMRKYLANLHSYFPFTSFLQNGWEFIICKTTLTSWNNFIFYVQYLLMLQNSIIAK
jgi:hypothetical protein